MTTEEIVLAVLTAHGVWDPATCAACQMRNVALPDDGPARLHLFMDLEAALARTFRAEAYQRLRTVFGLVREAPYGKRFERET